MVLVGVQPSLMQVPPTCSRSTSAVFRPAPASAELNGVPAWPEPTTIASYCSIPLIGTPPVVTVRFGSWPDVSKRIYHPYQPPLRPATQPLRCPPDYDDESFLPAAVSYGDGRGSTRLRQRGLAP